MYVEILRLFPCGYGIMARMLKERMVQWAERWIRLPVAGLDISDRSIKYVKFSDDRSGGLEQWGEEQIAEGILVEGRIEKEQEFIAILRALHARFGSKWHAIGVAASLPEEKSFLRLLQMPRVKPEEIAGALRWQIEGQIPLPAEDLAYDYQIIEPFVGTTDHLDIVITAYPKGIVESYAHVLKESGFQPVALELESQAIARAVLEPTRAPEAVMVIDMGRNRASIAVCAAGSVLFTATLSVGGRRMEEEIARIMAVAPEEALRIKKEEGFVAHARGGKVYEALLPLMDTLAGETARTAAYYEDRISHIHGGNPGIARIVLSGGDANLLGLDTYLASRAHIPVEVADPLRGAGGGYGRYLVPAMPKNEALAFAAAIGLARRE